MEFWALTAAYFHVSVIDMKEAATSRAYRMTSRATSARLTSERILDAVTALFWERPTDQIVLADVAARAGITVQTVIRRFGGREGLMTAAADRALAHFDEQRRVTPDDVDQAVAHLVEHYEQRGQGVLRLLAAEASSPGLAAYADRGRAFHRQWCADSFPAALTGLKGAERSRRMAQLVAVTDVYMWKLLRLDAGLSRPQLQLALLELLEPLLTAPDPKGKC